MFLFNKIGEKGRTGSAWKQGGWGGEERGQGQGEEMAQTMYVHMNKKKTDIKERKKWEALEKKCK
jgi:hypothetical protein